MTNYLISDGNAEYNVTLPESGLQSYLSELGVGFAVISGTAVSAPDPAAKLAADMDFGASLIREFLLDNRNDPNVKTADSLSLLVKFGPAENLLRLGDIRKCRALIDSFTTDLIFTDTRKTKYLSMIDNHLSL